MTDEERKNGDAPKPMCPNCKADPVMPAFQQFNLGPFMLGIAFCSACRHPIPVTLLGIQQPKIARPAVVMPKVTL